MTRFQVQFYKADGLNETDIGESYGVNADNLEEAEGEARSMGPPGDANFMKILDDGRVVKRIGFGL